MEAKALHSFEATQSDELAFRKGNKLKILNKEDENWFKAECEGREGYIPSNYVELIEPEWYKGKIKRHDAEQMLLQMTSTGHYQQPDGAFVVRKSESDDTGHSLSVKHGNGVQHFKILHDKNSGTFYLWNQNFSSINDLIEYHRTVSVSKHDSQTSILLRDMVSGSQGIPCKALYNFDADDDSELSFKKGDTFTILEKLDSNWWKADLNGTIGLVPSNHVQEI